MIIPMMIRIWKLADLKSAREEGGEPLARMEDEEEIRREEERIQEKKRRKLEAEKKKAKVGK